MIDRRNILKIGTVLLGLSGASAAPALGAPRRRARACILLFMDGGPSHIDLFDLKPGAPSEIRGPFSSIPTTVPGVRLCEHLPGMARQMHRIAQVRSVRHGDDIHDPAVYQTLTGYAHTNSRGDLDVQPTDFPHVASLLSHADQHRALMPPVIELPETMKMGARVLPGQNGGFLGARHDPFRVEVTREADVIPPEVAPSISLPRERLSRRASLLQRLNRRVENLGALEAPDRLHHWQQQALAILGQPAVHQAFDLNREPPRVRDRYGRHRHGQSVLLARRLVEAGARFVTVYWGREMQDWAEGRGPQLANNPWDTHRNHFPLLKDELLPRADQALSALLEDLHGRGLLDETLVVWMGEFGRTPHISQFGSRDHWPGANTILMAGAGVTGGAVFGKTDEIAAEVTEDPVSPADVTATILDALGASPEMLVRGPQGRQYPLSTGRPIRRLFA